MKYLGYSFVEAVIELNRFRSTTENNAESKLNDSEHMIQTTVSEESNTLPTTEQDRIQTPDAQTLLLPTAANPPYRHIFGFLNARGMEYKHMKKLVFEGLL